MIAADPDQGGATWAVLQYLLGLRQLGHEVYFVEPLAAKAVRPPGYPLAESQNAAYFRSVVEDFGLTESAALLLVDSEETIGLSHAEVRAVAQRADLLINVSGMLTDPALVEPIPVRLYLDLDPAFNQLWHHACGIDMRFNLHTHFATVGLALGTLSCPVPDCGLAWMKTPQPIVLEKWPVATRIETDALTTIGNWRGYGSVEFQGEQYGQKAHSLRRLLELPRRTPEKFALAMGIHPAETSDLAALAENGWQLLDPTVVAGTPTSYRRFIQGSKAEFGIAKSGYVLSRCGWFSDRSVCYLASGRPVIAQETGFSAFFPTGDGLFAFVDSDDVLSAIDMIHGDYERHARAARAIAEEHFEAGKVLSRLLEQLDLRV